MFPCRLRKAQKSLIKHSRQTWFTFAPSYYNGVGRHLVAEASHKGKLYVGGVQALELENRCAVLCCAVLCCAVL